MQRVFTLDVAALSLLGFEVLNRHDHLTATPVFSARCDGDPLGGVGRNGGIIEMVVAAKPPVFLCCHATITVVICGES